MRHVCFVNTTPFWGGGERSHLEKALAFARRGYRVSVVADPGGKLLARARAGGLDTFGLALGKWSWLNPLAHRRLTRYFRRTRPDAVVLNASNDLKVGAPAARRAGITRVVYLRGLAAPIRDTLPNRYLLGEVVTRVIANSAATRATVLARLRIRPDRVTVVHHGIDLRGDQPPTPQARARSPLVIGNAGRLTRQKAQRELIAAVGKLRARGVAVELRIAGTGELRAELERQIAAAGLREHVRLEGFVEDMDGFYRSLDAFALPSHWEGYGFVLAEAMRWGLPVVAYDVSSNPEIVADGVTGLLAPVGDVDAFAQRLERLADDPQLRRDLGAGGQARVRERFELERQLSRFAAAVFDEGLSPKPTTHRPKR